ncbi:transposase, partial [Thiolapillus sp.]|uniref:transposase n=1 Tax=Thiolapillus sp. TaxID=2017437 RepID=UPI003AF7F58E
VLPVTNCNQEWTEFPAVKRRKVQAAFSGGDITSDGGVLLLRDMDRRLGLLESVNRVLHDPRDSDRVVHSQLSLLRQRIYGLCLGYEDLNDHQDLRLDPALQTAVNRDTPLASQATLCRLENRMDRSAMVALHKVLVEQFIASFNKQPRKLILDFDATDDRVHGQQACLRPRDRFWGSSPNGVGRLS